MQITKLAIAVALASARTGSCDAYGWKTSLGDNIPAVDVHGVKNGRVTDDEMQVRLGCFQTISHPLAFNKDIECGGNKFKFTLDSRFFPVYMQKSLRLTRGWLGRARQVR